MYFIFMICQLYFCRKLIATYPWTMTRCIEGAFAAAVYAMFARRLDKYDIALYLQMLRTAVSLVVNDACLYRYVSLSTVYEGL